MTDLANDLIREILEEKRSEKRWKNIRFVCWFLLTLMVVVMIASGIYGTNVPVSARSEKYVALVRLEGMISPGKSFSAAQAIPVLQDAFADQEAKGVILDINSGGGTPVQASIIHDAIIKLKKKYHKKVIVVGEDMLTSGAYFVAVSADKIYVNPNTLTGSIGVIMKSFGFVEAMKKIGVERRVYISGSDKDRLDPFLPQDQQDITKVQTVINEVHENFNQTVLEGRKGRLHGDPKELFSGDFWTGQSALKLGLVDGLGNLQDVMEREFKVTRFQEYSSTPPFLRMFTDQFDTLFDKMFQTRLAFK